MKNRITQIIFGVLMISMAYGCYMVIYTIQSPNVLNSGIMLFGVHGMAVFAAIGAFAIIGIPKVWDE